MNRKTETCVLCVFMDDDIPRVEIIMDKTNLGLDVMKEDADLAQYQFDNKTYIF